MATKHDNEFYLKVLAKRRPDVLARYRSGAFRSVAAALIEAGIRKPAKPLHALQRAWKNASAADRETFLLSTGHGDSGTGGLARSKLSPDPLADPEGRLTDEAKDRLRAVIPLLRGSYNTGPMLVTMGFRPLNASLSTALHRERKLSKEMIDKLEVWLPLEEARRKAD